MSSSSETRSPVELLADDFLARHKRGEKPTIKEYCDRHPDLAGEIRDVFEAVLMVEDLKPGSGDVTGAFGESVKVNGKRLEQVGDYRILCEIGRGGMGVVYEAEQQALGRRVALKVLPKTAAGSAPMQIRFQREAKAAARMHHTNIVPVFDVGQDGEHLYYAMQLIHGQGLDMVIEDVKRLRAKSVVAQEKPGPGAPGPGFSEHSIAASLVAGKFEQENLAEPLTPGASPLSTGARGGNATAAYEGSVPSSAVLPGQSDISSGASNRSAYFRSIAQIGLQAASALSYAHSRGIIHRDIKPGNLILDTTGNVWVTDFGLAKTGDGGMTHTGDILGTIRYMSPERFKGECDVRADVYALGMTLYELLALKAAYASEDRLKLIELVRQTEPANPRTLDARIPLDLETIVMKAIDKDPKRRYQSADEMAEDLQRFVADEPIKARRVGAMERFTRWCRRNPAVAGLTAAVFLLMAVGTAISIWQAVLANRARADLASRNDELAQEQAKVQARFELAQKAIALFHTGVSEDALLKNAEFKELRTKLLREAKGFYEDLEKLLAGQTDAKSRQALAAAYSQLGELTDKIGDKQEGLAVHRKALALRRELAAAEGADAEARLDVARSLNAVGNLLRETGDSAGALAAFEEQRDLAAALLAESPSDAIRAVLASGHYDIGRVLYDTGKPAEALRAFEQARDVNQKLVAANPTVPGFQRELARNHNGIGWLLIRTGKPAEALRALEQARDILQKPAAANPAVTLFQRDLANVLLNMGGALEQTGKPAEALRAHEQARDILQKLVKANPAVTLFQSDLARSHNSIGAMLVQTGKPAESLRAHEQARDIRQKLTDANPAVTQFQSDLAQSHNNIGDVLVRTGRPAEALRAYEQVRDIRQKLADANPTIPGFQSDLAESHANVADTFKRWGKPAEALEGFRKALPIQQKLVDAHPANTSYQRNLADIHKMSGEVLGRLKRFAEAFAAFDASIAICLKLAEADPRNTGVLDLLADTYTCRGGARVWAGQPAEAAADLRRALELWDKVPTVTTQQPDSEVGRAQALALLAGLGGDAKSGVTKDEAKQFADRSVALLAEVVKSGWAYPTELKEPDFDALRGRADFQKLVAEMEAKAGKASESSGKP